MKVGIIGAKGIGRYHVREFLDLGAEVAVACSSENSALEYRKVHPKIPAYGTVDELLAQGPDAVSVCSPNQMHYTHAKSALEKGIHVLCEKPLNWDSQKTPEENLRQSFELFDIAKSKDAILTVNTQLVSLFDIYVSLRLQAAGPDGGLEYTSFNYKQHICRQEEGVETLVDILPHALAMLLAFYDDARILKISGDYDNNTWQLNLQVSSQHEVIPAVLELGISGERLLEFGIDGIIATRHTETDSGKPGYLKSFLKLGEKSIEVEDPLAVSINCFLAAVQEHKKPDYSSSNLIVSPEMAFRNAMLMYKILDWVYYSPGLEGLTLQQPPHKKTA